jgi:hypothetical protein
MDFTRLSVLALYFLGWLLLLVPDIGERSSTAPIFEAVNHSSPLSWDEEEIAWAFTKDRLSCRGFAPGLGVGKFYGSFGMVLLLP